MDARSIDTDVAPPFGDPVLDAVYHYWDGRRAGRLAPARADIDPVHMPRRALPYLALGEVLRGPPRDIRVRVFGTALAEAMGSDITGRLLSEVVAEAPGPAADAVLADYHAVVDRFAPHHAARTAAWLGRDHVHYRRLALPLSADGRTVDMILAVVAIE